MYCAFPSPIPNGKTGTNQNLHRFGQMGIGRCPSLSRVAYVHSNMCVCFSGWKHAQKGYWTHHQLQNTWRNGTTLSQWSRWKVAEAPYTSTSDRVTQDIVCAKGSNSSQHPKPPSLRPDRINMDQLITSKVKSNQSQEALSASNSFKFIISRKSHVALSVFCIWDISVVLPMVCSFKALGGTYRIETSINCDSFETLLRGDDIHYLGMMTFSWCIAPGIWVVYCSRHLSGILFYWYIVPGIWFQKLNLCGCFPHKQ